MAAQRPPSLDALEKRLVGPKKIALFGHRAVGKTTLLAMFYREASNGQIPGLRLAAVGARGAEYLADKIARIEAGESPAGTLTETDLELRLYRGPARIDLIVKDYQGEHVALGSDASILEFFADCDAVLLCLESCASAPPAERRTRQQEIEHLLERYIASSDDSTTGRPVALLLTKYDRVLGLGSGQPETAERLVEERYGMTLHALTTHAPRSAIFAVSSYGSDAPSDGSPPSHLEPMGLDGPLIWLVEQLEASDRELLEWIWDLAPRDAGRLGRCIRAFAKRYPNSNELIAYRRRLKGVSRRQLGRSLIRAVGLLVLGIIGVAGYDAVGFHLALRYEQADQPPSAVAQRWSSFLAWHPTQPFFWPGESRRARAGRDLALVEAARVRAESGVGNTGTLQAELTELKENAPKQAAAIRDVESTIRQREAERRWQAIRAEALLPSRSPEDRLAMIREFLGDDPDTPYAREAVDLAEAIGTELDALEVRRERDLIDALILDAKLPEPDYLTLIERARTFLEDRPKSRHLAEVRGLLESWIERLDSLDFERARSFEQTSPTQAFDEQVRRYRDYLLAHDQGGRHAEQAKAAIDRIEARRDAYLYRQAFDHWAAHPSDAAEVARRLRDYLSSNPSGAYVGDAEAFLEDWERLNKSRGYEVTLVRGDASEALTKRLSGGGPDLGVVLWVGGVKYGPSPVIPDTLHPVWNYRFPTPVRWKYGDDVVIQLIDHDWSDSTVATLRSGDDPLAMRVLSGTVRPSRSKGLASIEFRSDFRMPRLPRPRVLE